MEASRQDAPLIGRTIGNYRVAYQLGEGGMGIVYVAEHELVGKRVAVKALLSEYSADREVVERFFNEAKAATVISHPGIVDIYDFGYADDGTAYIVMELLEGRPLDQVLLEEGVFSEQRVVSISWQLAAALGAAHAAGIVHRDLKPDNIFLIPDDTAFGGERVKVLDFGIAKLAGDGMQVTSHTRTGMIMGTPTYMSPEQCRGSGEVDHRSDIYSLGCLMFEMSCGRPPFEGTGLGEMLSAHMNTPPPRPREAMSENLGAPPRPSAIQPAITDAFEQVILKTLEKDPGDRYQDMGDLASALNVFRDVSGPVAMPAAARDGRVSSARENTTLTSAASESHGDWDDDVLPTNSRVPLLVAAVAVMLLAGGGVMALSGGEGKSEQHAQAATTPPAPAAERQPEPVAAPSAEKEMVTVRITTEPPAASVYSADGTRLGETPFDAQFEVSQSNVPLLIKRDRYLPLEVTVDPSGGGERAFQLRRMSKKERRAQRREAQRRRARPSESSSISSLDLALKNPAAAALRTQADSDDDKPSSSGATVVKPAPTGRTQEASSVRPATAPANEDGQGGQLPKAAAKQDSTKAAAPKAKPGATDGDEPVKERKWEEPLELE